MGPFWCPATVVRGRFGMEIGARAPLHTTAAGKIFLLEDGPDKCREYAQRTGLEVFTRNTIRGLTALNKALDRVRKLGYALDNEEAENGVSCIGAGIHDDEGRLVAGLLLSAPSNRVQRAWYPRVKQVANEISRALGHLPGAGQREGIRSGTRPDQPEMRSTSASIQRLMRLASAILENLPQESSNTMITDLSAIMACITRQRPASLM